MWAVAMQRRMCAGAAQGGKRVLVLCTGNSCRSHMAEALINKRLGDANVVASSAGTKPAGYVHPMAVKALEEVGCDLSKHSSKHTDDVQGEYDVIYTVCDNASRDTPDWAKSQRVVHIPFDDPAYVEGTDEEKMAVFRRVRDEIDARLIEDVNNVGKNPASSA